MQHLQSGMPTVVEVQYRSHFLILVRVRFRRGAQAPSKRTARILIQAQRRSGWTETVRLPLGRLTDISRQDDLAVGRERKPESAQ